MSAIASLTLADGLTSPANHTFTPVRPQQNTDFAEWRELNADNVPASRRVLLRVKAGANASTVTMRIMDPVATVVDSNCCNDERPMISYTTLAVLEFSLPNKGTLANRKDILAYAKNLLASAPVVSAVQNLETVW